MRQKKFEHKINKLRAPERVDQLEVQRVVSLCTENCHPADMLDVGTGSGLFAEAFAARGIKIIGIDPDADMIAAARFCVSELIYSVARAEALPFADNCFDTLFMGMVLHETAEPLLALREARRVAQKFLAILEWPPHETGDPPPPARRFAPPEIVSMSRAAAFSACSVIELRQLILYLLR